MARIDKPIRDRILHKIQWLASHPDRPAEALGGEFAGLLKLRVGAYRVIYSRDIAQRGLTVHAVGHRRDIYRV